VHCAKQQWQNMLGPSWGKLGENVAVHRAIRAAYTWCGMLCARMQMLSAREFCAQLELTHRSCKAASLFLIVRGSSCCGVAPLPAFALLTLICCHSYAGRCTDFALCCCCCCSKTDCHGNLLVKAFNISCHFALRGQGKVQQEGRSACATAPWHPCQTTVCLLHCCP
jgi:hypothetical protein